MSDFVWRDGQRLTTWMNHVIDVLDRDFYAAWGLHIRVSSAIRLAQEQLDIWYDRYTRTPNGRYVYDTRWWNGATWYRISSAGTVAPPGSSNHEIQGDKAAVDLRDTGNDAGVATMGSARSNWLRARAGNYGLVASGFGFGEAWHYDVLGIYRTPPAPAGGGESKPVEEPEEEDEDMSRPICVANRNRNGITTVRIFDLATGEEHMFTSTNDAAGDAYIKNVALTYGVQPNVPVSYITDSHFGKIGQETAATRARLDERAGLGDKAEAGK